MTPLPRGLDFFSVALATGARGNVVLLTYSFDHDNNLYKVKYPYNV